AASGLHGRLARLCGVADRRLLCRLQAHALLRNATQPRVTRPGVGRAAQLWTRSLSKKPRHFLLYGSERYALAILRPLQDAIRARGDETAWFFDGPGADELRPDEKLLTHTRQVRDFAPEAVLTSSNAVPHFFPGVKVEVFHGFDAGKPRHIYIRGFFDLYCTTGPRDTDAFTQKAGELGHFAVRQT